MSMTTLNEHHVENLTKDIASKEIGSPLGNVVQIGHLAGLSNVEIQHVLIPKYSSKRILIIMFLFYYSCEIQ